MTIQEAKLKVVAQLAEVEGVNGVGIGQGKVSVRVTDEESRTRVQGIVGKSTEGFPVEVIIIGTIIPR